MPAAGAPGSPPCPTVLMFDGVDITRDDNEAKARYWAETIGVGGFFLNNIFSSWQTAVGDDEQGALYQRVSRFQALYSKYHVAENFIKVAIYFRHDWQDPKAEAQVVANFRQAAHLARFAGLKGLALDLEPYVDGTTFWEEGPGGGRAARAYALGRRIGGAILSEFPEATVIVLPEVLQYVAQEKDQKARAPGKEIGGLGFALTEPFWNGLTQARFQRLVIAAETSFDLPAPDATAVRLRDVYRANLAANGVDARSVTVAVGLWPLGRTYTDKSPRCRPDEFEARLRSALATGAPYVWLYAHGSAWETDGPYGKGRVAGSFNGFVEALQRTRRACAKQ